MYLGTPHVTGLFLKYQLYQTNLPIQNPESLYKLSKLDKDTIVLPGHGEATTIGFETENNIYL